MTGGRVAAVWDFLTHLIGSMSTLTLLEYNVEVFISEVKNCSFNGNKVFSFVPEFRHIWLNCHMYTVQHGPASHVHCTAWSCITCTLFSMVLHHMNTVQHGPVSHVHCTAWSCIALSPWFTYGLPWCYFCWAGAKPSLSVCREALTHPGIISNIYYAYNY